MKATPWQFRDRTHLSERSIMRAADQGGTTDKGGTADPWSSRERAHLLECARCRSLYDTHRQLVSALGGEWGRREIPAVVPAPHSAPMPRLRSLLIGVFVVALAVASGTWWAWRSGPPAAQPSPSFALYPVNPGGTSVDMDACVTPADKYGAGQPDWGESYLSGGYILNFTGQPAAHVSALRALVPSDCSIYVRIVPVSSAAGRALQARISDDMASLNAAGVPVWGVGFDPISDKVKVALSAITPGARAEIERRYPAQMVDLVEGVEPVPLPLPEPG